ncbi:MAG: hypothetical protein L6R42_000164 [Xanthoria sp. 1 TBL-2021]|nr:MAG: hypothetical protein L6R42_000164 [Xanthoria sp. 1 TBL-2021]
MSFLTPSSVLQEAREEPTDVSSDSDKLLGDDYIPDLDVLSKLSVPSGSTPKIGKPTTISQQPLSTPSTSSKPPRLNPTSGPQTPTGGLRPARGLHPNPPQSHNHKRTWSQDSGGPGHHPSSTSPTSKKRRRPTPSIPLSKSKTRSRSTTTKYGDDISRVEAQRASRAIIEEANWKRIAKDVGLNRPGEDYERLVARELEKWQEKLGDPGYESGG